MPIYEYQCGECGHRLEALQKISDTPLKDCPHCRKAGLVRLVSASSFRLKGGGWYETDFKTGAKRHGTQDSSAESPASVSGSKPESAKSAAEATSSAAGAVKPAAV
ncbi:MAG: zinc ribbon domain-containing protein [Pseudomonadota bacterium]